MRLSEITSANKPYIRIVKGKKRVDIPIVPKLVLLPPNKSNYRKYAFVGCENIRVRFKGKTVKLNWTFNHNKMTLYCSSGHKAYSWTNVKVATITSVNGKKEQLLVCKHDYGDETERRKYKRYPMIKRVTITQGSNVFDGATVDISYGGVGISVKRNIKVIPSEPLSLDFGDSKKVKARLVRTVFKDDGSEILGCFIPAVFKSDMVRLVHEDDTLEVAKSSNSDREKQRDTDRGWYEGQIKRWH